MGDARRFHEFQGQFAIHRFRSRPERNPVVALFGDGHVVQQVIPWVEVADVLASAFVRGGFKGGAQLFDVRFSFNHTGNRMEICGSLSSPNHVHACNIVPFADGVKCQRLLSLQKEDVFHLDGRPVVPPPSTRHRDDPGDIVAIHFEAQRPTAGVGSHPNVKVVQSCECGIESVLRPLASFRPTHGKAIVGTVAVAPLNVHSVVPVPPSIVPRRERAPRDVVGRIHGIGIGKACPPHVVV